MHPSLKTFYQRTIKLCAHSFLPASLLVLLALLTVQVAFAAGTVTGTVFRDFNANGTQDAGEPGAGGVTITAYGPAGNVLATAVSFPTRCFGAADPAPACTGANTPVQGSYSLTWGGTDTQARIEFTALPAGSQPGAWGGGSDTTVQFVDTSGGTPQTANAGINRPRQFCNRDPTNVRVITTCFVSGDPLQVGSTALSSVVTVPYLANDASAEFEQGQNTQTGAVWGVGFQRSTQFALTAAALKRHSGLGAAGLGGIYRTPIGVLNSATLLVDVEAEFGLNLGTIGDNVARGLNPDATIDSADLTAFPLIGKVGMGDLDIADDDQTVFFVNLFDRSIYGFRITIASPPTVVPGSFLSLGAPSVACNNGVARPWGLDVYEDRLYAGYVCTAELGGTRADLTANIFSVPVTGGAWTPVVTGIRLDYDKGDTGLARYPVGHPRAIELVDQWETWEDTFNGANFFGYSTAGNEFQPVARPQPILSDIEFDTDGSMVLAFMDRAGHQLGHRNTAADGTSTLLTGIAGGDIIRLCEVNGAFQIEGGGTCPGRTAPANANGQGPGGGEYYNGEAFPAAPASVHEETGYGGLAFYPGLPDVVMSAMDPENFDAGGLIWLSNTDGSKVRDVDLYQDVGVNAPTSGKANGIGDLELTCGAAPIEIGNRVWIDADRSGVQDPDETPLGGIRVELRTSAGALIAFTTTAADGSYIFSNDVGTTGNGRVYGLSALAFNTDYQVVIPLDDPGNRTLLAGLIPTDPNNTTSPSVSDLNDSDGIVSGNQFIAAFRTGPAGFNNHSYDFGFSPPVTPTAPAVGNPPAGPPAGGPIISKSVDRTIVAAGDIAIWTITVRNTTGLALPNVGFIDPMPAQLEILSATASAGNVSVSNQDVTFSIDPLPANTTVTVSVRTRVRASVRPPFLIVNTARLTGLYSGSASARIASDQATLLSVAELPATGEVPWWRIPLAILAGGALIMGGLALARRRTLRQ
jgi:uncharacterized repeat protein (TIGR01451 family)